VFPVRYKQVFISQKTAFFIVTSVTMSNLTCHYTLNKRKKQSTSLHNWRSSQNLLNSINYKHLSVIFFTFLLLLLCLYLSLSLSLSHTHIHIQVNLSKQSFIFRYPRSIHVSLLFFV
jgi:hypothetical protein